MLSTDPQSNLFGFQIPDDFFFPSITEKYDKVLKAMGGTFTSIVDVINESIQTVQIPGMSFEMVTQEDSGSTGLNTISLPDKKLRDTIESHEIIVSLRHIDGFLNYFCLLEHFIKYFKHKRDDSVNGETGGTIKSDLTLPIILLQRSGNPIFVVLFQRCYLTNIPQLEFTYNQSIAEFKTFDIKFYFYEFMTKVSLPKITPSKYTQNG